MKTNCSNLNAEKINSCTDFLVPENSFEFRDGFCFKNGDVYGKIIRLENKLITVEVDNENKYMKGQVVNFIIETKTPKQDK